VSTSLLAAERSITGGVMLYGRRALALLNLEPEDLHHPVHAVTLRAALDLDAAGQPIDAITLQHQLERARVWNQPILANGLEKWHALQDAAAVPEALPHYAAIVRSHALRRRMRQTLAKLQALTDREPGDDEEYLGEVQRILAETTSSVAQVEARSMDSVITQRMAAFEERRRDFRDSGGKIKGLPTGIGGIDRAIDGLQDGRLYVLAGRPKMGKSSMALTWALNCGVPTLIFNLEMSADEQADRAIVQGSSCNAEAFNTASVSQAEFQRIFRRAVEMTRLPLFLDDKSRRWAQILLAARRWRAKQQGRALIIIDYLQLIEATGKRNREEEIAQMSRGLKALAAELKCPIVVLAQLNRKCEERADKRPVASDLRESGAIEQDADMVCFVYRDHVYNNESPEDEAEFIVGLARYCPKKTVEVIWHGPSLCFRDKGVRR